LWKSLKKTQEDADIFEEKKDKEYKRKMDDWNTKYPNYQNWGSYLINGDAAKKTAMSYFEAGDYSQAVATLAKNAGDEDKLGFKAFGFSYRPGTKYSEEQAMTAIKSYMAGLKTVKDKVKDANIEREQIAGTRGKK
jgi:hypothetical protein